MKNQGWYELPKDAHNVYRNLTRQARIDCAFFMPLPKPPCENSLFRLDRDPGPDYDERRSLLMPVDQPFRLLRRRLR
jgi:hypothetical protein